MSDMDYGYPLALKAAGADVHAYEEFGTYSGDWFAFITFDGKKGFIHDYFGSCSACDAFLAEVGYADNSDYQSQLRDFGAKYLDNILSFDSALAEASKYIEWDLDAEKMVAWVRAREADCA